MKVSKQQCVLIGDGEIGIYSKQDVTRLSMVTCRTPKHTAGKASIANYTLFIYPFPVITRVAAASFPELEVLRPPVIFETTLFKDKKQILSNKRHLVAGLVQYWAQNLDYATSQLCENMLTNIPRKIDSWTHTVPK